MADDTIQQAEAKGKLFFLLSPACQPRSFVKGRCALPPLTSLASPAGDQLLSRNEKECLEIGGHTTAAGQMPDTLPAPLA